MPGPIRNAPSVGGPAAAPGSSYTVRPGDTLSTIAKKVLGDAGRWKEILDLNKGFLPTAEKLAPGMKLALPAGAAPMAATPTPPPPARPQVSGPEARHADSFQKVVSLTFDDGPHPVNTPRVLDILKQHDVKATFFVTGQGVEKHPELIRQIVARGHALGNHTYSHANLAKLTPAQAKAEFDRTQAAIDKALGYHYDLQMIRPPYGAGPGVAKAAMNPGQSIVLWNVDSEDWKYTNNDAKIVSNIFEGANSVHARGDTILFHDIQPQTVRILDSVISRLQKEGFDVQRTDLALARKKPNLG